ncbi:MAG: hypothetical protein DRO14_06555 [Thermoprotei archaeon]|nr:MAG: hypothetical protein DRO14_06555 [Thermoprotei archaeon]
MLLIECGPTNTRFSFKENNVEMPFIRRTFLALKDYEGDVVYYQHDIALPFPFGECLREVKESYVMGLSKINLTRMTWELGREKLFFGNKRWIILHNTLNEEFFIKYCSTKRYKYEHFIREGLMKTRYITQLLVSHCDIEEMGMEPNSNPKYDLMYVGKEKDKFRTQLILQYYDSPKIRSCIIGKWKSKPWRYIEYLGVRGKQGETIRFYNSALATVFVPTEYMKKGGILTSRITQALLGGCVVFIHRDIYGIEKLVDPRIQNVCIVTPSEFEDKLEVLKSVDLETRKFIVELERKYLLKRYCDFDWNRLLHW